MTYSQEAGTVEHTTQHRRNILCWVFTTLTLFVGVFAGKNVCGESTVEYKLNTLRQIAKVANVSARDARKLSQLLGEIGMVVSQKDPILDKFIQGRLDDLRRLSMDA